MERSILMDNWGWYLEVYYEDEEGAEFCGRWYGASRAECEAVKSEDVQLYPIGPEPPDPFDLACERRWD